MISFCSISTQLAARELLEQQLEVARKDSEDHQSKSRASVAGLLQVRTSIVSKAFFFDC